MITSFDHYECHTCRYMISVEEMTHIIADLPCPRCGDLMSNAHFIKARDKAEEGKK